MTQNPKLALCGLHKRKLRLFDRIDICVDSNYFSQLRSHGNKCIIFSLCNLQKEQNGEVTFPNLKSVLYANGILCKTLYWNMRVFVSKVALENTFF